MNPEMEYGHECTSWIITPELTGGKFMLLHKNRDLNEKTRISGNQNSPAGKNSWIAVGSPEGGVNMGINSRGLALAMNSADRSDGKSPGPGLGTVEMAQAALEECATAAEAVEFLRGLVKARNYHHDDRGSMWFAADSKQAFIAEHDLLRFASHEIKFGFAIRANVWHYPEMLIYSQSSPAERISNLRRECAVQNSLFDGGTAYNVPVTVEKVAEASRIDRIPEDPECYPLCCARTNSAATITIDCEYPELLSTVYSAFGPPRHTAYLPVPSILAELPAEIRSGTFGDAVIARADAKRDLLPMNELAEFELGSNERHRAAVEMAREKLKNGGTREDVQKILTEVFQQNWEALRKLSEGR